MATHPLSHDNHMIRTSLLLRKREEPLQTSFPSAIMAIRSPNKSASSLRRKKEEYNSPNAGFLWLAHM